MIISCPNCAARYDIDPALIGATGKVVRCANCATEWTQSPPATPQPAPAPQPVPAPAPEPAPEPEPEPAPEPEPEAAPEPEDAADAETAPADEEAAPETEEEPLSQDELDNLFGEEEEPEPIPSLAEDSKGTGDSDEGDDIHPDDIPEPDSIPESLAADILDDDDDDMDDLPGDGRGKRLIIGIVISLALLGAIFAGLIFGRGMIVSMVPAVTPIYSALDNIGIGGEALGAGLEFRGVRPDRATEGTIDIIIVRGTIANITDIDRAVPAIRASLFNTNGEEIEAMVITPSKTTLKPGEKIDFEARFKDAPATARQVGTTFTEDTPAN